MYMYITLPPFKGKINIYEINIYFYANMYFIVSNKQTRCQSYKNMIYKTFYEI